jgi:RimJ/RimL family protein N-acetyltransferase
MVELGDLREPIGFVQATVPVNGGPTEVAWVIGRPWQGNGYATAAARLLLDDLAGRGVTAVMAHIHPAHVASQRIAQHLGLTPTGVVVDGETRWVGRATPS